MGAGSSPGWEGSQGSWRAPQVVAGLEVCCDVGGWESGVTPYLAWLRLTEVLLCSPSRKAGFAGGQDSRVDPHASFSTLLSVQGSFSCQKEGKD